jgi:hypothetical protein
LNNTNYDSNVDDSAPKSITLNLNSDFYDDSLNKKISIPLDPTQFKDKDHINLDINLRLVDFLNQQQNRSFDDFDVHNDPLSRHIRKFETNMSRSLPGSSGSLNNFNKLPPLTKRNKPHSHQDYRQNYDNGSYEREMPVEEGYLAQLQKSHQPKPVIKTYTLKDYKNFKKDTLTTTNTNTGKLGPDFENETYKQRVWEFLSYHVFSVPNISFIKWFSVRFIFDKCAKGFPIFRRVII